MPTPQQVTNLVVRGETPTPEIQRALAEHESGLPVVPLSTVPAKVRDENGNIIRQDWSRNEQGRFFSKSSAMVTPRWFRGQSRKSASRRGQDIGLVEKSCGIATRHRTVARGHPVEDCGRHAVVNRLRRSAQEKYKPHIDTVIFSRT
jgi:hypothetical protein